MSEKEIINTKNDIESCDSDYDTDISLSEIVDTERSVYDFGESHYVKACEHLNITPAKRIIEGLKGSELQLRYRSLGPDGAKALAAGLLNNTKVEILNLEENGLEGEGCLFIADMLQENHFITRVYLAKNNIGTLGAIAIGEMLKVNGDITHLDISENKFRDSDAEYLSLGLEYNERVVWLDLSKNNFSEDGAQLLGKALGSNNCIEDLNLSWNQFRRKGAVILCNSLKRNICLSHVDLAWNGFGYEGAVAVGEMLRGNKYLKVLDISNNRINWDGAIVVAKGLKENDNLEKLHIGHNPLTMTGCLDILESVDTEISVTSYIGFDGIPVNRRVIFMTEVIQKQRPFSIKHGGLLESEDIFGRRFVLRYDPLKLLMEFLTEKGIRPVDLFRTFDKDNQHRVSRTQFVQGLKKAHVPLDDYEMERVLNRLDSAKDGRISYQRLMRGVKEQIKVSREEEKARIYDEQKKLEEQELILSRGNILPPITESSNSLSQSTATTLNKVRPTSGTSSIRSYSTVATLIPFSLKSFDVSASSKFSHGEMSSFSRSSGLASLYSVQTAPLPLSRINMSAPLGVAKPSKSLASLNITKLQNSKRKDKKKRK